MADGTTLILGGSGSIGSALARHLVDAGRDVTLAATGEERLREVGEALGCRHRVCDAKDAEAVKTLVDELAREPGLSGAVCCVGSILLKPAHTTSPDEFQRTMRLNVETAFNTVRAAAGAMTRTGGSIVLLASAAARVGLSNHEAIAAAKAAVIGLGRSAASTYAPRGIRVNVVAPGLVESNMSAQLLANDASRKASEAMHPLGRVGQPDEVARAIAFLLDREQGWITGQVLGVDGGLGDVRPRG
ncbi:MAG: SDR family oxidoreductase [Planctomycetota bacterium]